MKFQISFPFLIVSYPKSIIKFCNGNFCVVLIAQLCIFFTLKFYFHLKMILIFAIISIYACNWFNFVSRFVLLLMLYCFFLVLLFYYFIFQNYLIHSKHPPSRPISYSLPLFIIHTAPHIIYRSLVDLVYDKT